MELLLAVSTYLASFSLLLVAARFRHAVQCREAAVNAWKARTMASDRRSFLRAHA